MRGKGLAAKSGRGDLIAVLKVVMPPAATPGADELWRQLADRAGFDPREEWGKRT